MSADSTPDEHVHAMMNQLGMPVVGSSHYRDTPKRFVRYIEEMTLALREAPAALRAFESKSDQMIVQPKIQAASMCPHHLLPVLYDIDFGYLPNGKIVGLSKIARFIKHVARQPICQEDLVKLIVETFHQLLEPRGVIVVAEGLHTCMASRGINERARTITANLTGVFKDEQRVRDEFYRLAGR